MAARKTYHHGNLKEALLEAAVKLVSEVGLRGFTLREAARRAGVSHNAPYRHFRDREALLAAIAAEGFDELTRAMRTAADRQTGAVEQLRASGHAYVDFALRRPDHFTVMFDSAPDREKYPECAEAGTRSFQTLLELVARARGDENPHSEANVRRAQAAWALVHGIAKLANAGQLRLRSRAEVLGFTDYAVKAGVSDIAVGSKG